MVCLFVLSHLIHYHVCFLVYDQSVYRYWRVSRKRRSRGLPEGLFEQHGLLQMLLPGNMADIAWRLKDLSRWSELVYNKPSSHCYWVILPVKQTCLWQSFTYFLLKLLEMNMFNLNDPISIFFPICINLVLKHVGWSCVHPLWREVLPFGNNSDGEEEVYPAVQPYLKSWFCKALDYDLITIDSQLNKGTRLKYSSISVSCQCW